MIGERLRHAREYCELTQAELAALVKVQQSTIARIENGTLAPSQELSEEIARFTGYPVEFFYEETEFSMPLGSLIYRKNSRLSSSDRTRSYRIGRQAYMIFHQLAKKTTKVPVRVPRKLDEDPVTVARIVRDCLGVDPDLPIKNLVRQVERAGVVVLFLVDPFENLDGFSTWVDNEIPVVFLNPGRPGDRQRMTLAHELGHLVLHFGGLHQSEQDAWQFAGELHMPSEIAEQELSPPLSLSGLAQLKKKWGISIQALVQRAHSLKLITRNQRKYLHMQIARKNWGITEPIEVEVERPRRLRQMAELAFGEPIAFRRLAADVGLADFVVKRFLDPYATKLSGRAGSAQHVNVSPFRIRKP